ncbi:uroporphyrinogen-III methyltransferase [Rahnella aquatilis CIP 78.65 = ATCC 33071]|uniref:uroporphyrinogen-III C-methyltransferase n=2 Tax=Rahnella aquatilis TaxID=34038 RepID=H2IZA5_RAHAC|nr:uroporphyrin-III C-methyltransferase [Rahnella aquatilis CIP 78.65 = ATCC 33071]KFD13702.1 uroporphyrinogen-III methyltransferase [Rahnella aquatilis CIP 78.65 = ATCC 33071]
MNNILEKTLQMQQIAQILAGANRRNPVCRGEVWLVGAGPGDVELLTLKALRVIQQADVVVFDRLVSAPVMALIPDEALRIDAGKSTRNHTLGQEEINQLLVDLALTGHRVVRLKGGDPFVFGRGGEEMAHCQQNGVLCHIVPGITAAMGCAASSGIPLTHRNLAQSVRFVTGHGAQGEPDVDWRALAEARQTLVFYMGIAGSSNISQKLIAHGMPPEMPVAVIERGTQPEQRVFTGTLNSLENIIVANRVVTPALLIIGEVAGMYRQPAQAAAGVSPASQSTTRRTTFQLVPAAGRADCW